MSPIAFNNFRFTDSTLDLNGPLLSFTEEPSDVTVAIGATVSLTGVSTLSISPFSGTINYQWYNSTDGSAVSNGERTNESGSISTITGATSETLSIINAQYLEDNADAYYLEASYTPAGYGVETIGNPANEPLNSNPASIFVGFAIDINVQPAPNIDAVATDFTEFTVVASTSANNPTFDSRLTYQWSLDGSSLSDDDTVQGSNSDTLSIKRAVGSYSIKCTVGHQDSTDTVDTDSVTYTTKSSTGYVYSELITNRGGTTSRSVSNYNLNAGSFNANGPQHLNFIYSPNEDLDVIIEMTSSAGNSSGANAGGNGGWGAFKLKLLKDVEYLLELGSKDGTYDPIGGRVASPVNGALGGGMGILYKQNRPIAVLGAGGGAGAAGNGGDGGGLNISGQRGGGRNGGQGGTGGPNGRGVENLSSTQSASGGATAACISNTSGDYFRDTLGLSDCIDYWTYYGSKVEFIDQTGVQFNGQNGLPSSTSLFRGFRQGSAGRTNAGWGKDGNGGGGGGGAVGGDGSAGNQSGGGGGSGYANTGEVEVLRTSSGAWDGSSYAKVQLYTDSLAQQYRNGVYDPGSNSENIQQIEWNDSRSLGYKQGTENESQTNSGSIINTGSGSQSNPVNANWIEKITADNELVRTNQLFFSPEGRNASNLSYFMFNLLYKGVKHKTSDNSYLLNNRGNRDSSKGTTRRWYTETQNLLNNEPELYTNDKNEAFVPYRLEFSISLSFDNVKYSNEQIRQGTGGFYQKPSCVGTQNGWYTRTGRPISETGGDGFTGARTIEIFFDGELISGTVNEDGYVISGNYAYTFGDYRAPSYYGWRNDNQCGYSGPEGSGPGDFGNAFDVKRYNYSATSGFGGRWKVLTIPFGEGGLSYDFTSFDSRNDINFNSNQLAKYFNTPEARGILTDYNEVNSSGNPRYDYANPKIEYIRSRIINLDTNKINDLNLFMEFDNEDGAVDDNYVEIGKYVLT